MRISDWSSDVCSSDLEDIYADAKDINEARLAAQEAAVVEDASEEDAPAAE